jgi:hypothetical protein
VIPDDAYPGACHPYYAGHDRQGLWEAAKKHGTVHLMVPPVLHASFTDGAAPPETAPAYHRLELTVMRIWAPLPYVGQRRYALWPVLRDQHGRHIGPVWVDQITTHADPADYLNALPEQPAAVWCSKCGWWHLATDLLTRQGRRRLRQHRPYLS